VDGLGVFEFAEAELGLKWVYQQIKEKE